MGVSVVCELEVTAPESLVGLMKLAILAELRFSTLVHGIIYDLTNEIEFKDDHDQRYIHHLSYRIRVY
jgi:hypothetical protein